MLADEIVGLATQVYEQLETAGGTLTSVDDVGHVGGQNKRSSVPDDERRRRGRGIKLSLSTEAEATKKRFKDQKGL